MTLTGSSVYGGGLTVNSGALQIGAGGNLAASLTINATATLAFNRPDAFSFVGTIGGSGSVVQSGSGTTVLAANNNFTGGTFLNNGELSISADANLGGQRALPSPLPADLPGDRDHANQSR